MKPIERGSRPDSYQALNAKMAKVVRAEMAVAGVLMAAGLVVAALIRVSDYTATTGEFLARLLIGDGAALVYLGILSLLLIPVSCLPRLLVFLGPARIPACRRIDPRPSPARFGRDLGPQLTLAFAVPNEYNGGKYPACNRDDGEE